MVATCKSSISLEAVHGQASATTCRLMPTPIVHAAQAQPFGRWAAQEMAAAAVVAAAAANHIPPCMTRQSRAALVTNAQPSTPCGTLYSVMPVEPEFKWPLRLQPGQQQAELRKLLEDACRQVLCQTKAALTCLHPLRKPSCERAVEAVISASSDCSSDRLEVSRWQCPRQLFNYQTLTLSSMPSGCSEAKMGHSRRPSMLSVCFEG